MSQLNLNMSQLQHNFNCRSELSNSLRFHAELAANSGAITEFRFLNQRNPILIGHADDGGTRQEALYELFEAGPAGFKRFPFFFKSYFDSYSTYDHLNLHT